MSLFGDSVDGITRHKAPAIEVDRARVRSRWLALLNTA
jgi:hypothetical protein